MSTYYKYNFISPEPVYSIIKEELKSYFDTGAIDDLLFPSYLDKCLKKLGRTTYPIVEEVIIVEDFQVRLPDNFYAIREAWMCTEIPLDSYQDANSLYTQTVLATTIQVSPLTTGEVPCNSPVCTDPLCTGCLPEVMQAVYKTNGTSFRSYKQEYLLKPGSISAKSNCSVNYSGDLSLYGQHTISNPHGSSYDSFDIRDNKFVTNFRNGTVLLLFYATDFNNSGDQLIPDNYRIKEYIETFIKFKVFETLSNQVNDETFNQLQQKMIYHKQLSEEAYIMADIEIKKQDSWTKQRRVKKDLNRFNMYELPNHSNRFGIRRNN